MTRTATADEIIVGFAALAWRDAHETPAEHAARVERGRRLVASVTTPHYVEARAGSAWIQDVEDGWPFR